MSHRRASSAVARIGIVCRWPWRGVGSGVSAGRALVEAAPVVPLVDRQGRKEGALRGRSKGSRLSRAAAPGGSKSSEFARLAELHFLPRRATFFLSPVPTSHSRASLVRPFGIASEVLIFHLGFYFFHAKSVAPSTHLEHRILNPITQPLTPTLPPHQHVKHVRTVLQPKRVNK